MREITKDEVKKLPFKQLKQIHSLVEKKKGGEWNYSGTVYDKQGNPHTSVFVNNIKSIYVTVDLATLTIKDPTITYETTKNQNME